MGQTVLPNAVAHQSQRVRTSQVAEWSSRKFTGGEVTTEIRKLK